MHKQGLNREPSASASTISRSLSFQAQNVPNFQTLCTSSTPTTLKNVLAMPQAPHLTVRSLRVPPRTHSLRISRRRSTRVYRRESLSGNSQSCEDNRENFSLPDVPEVEPEEVDVIEFIDGKRPRNSEPEPMTLPHCKLARELCLTCLIASVLLFLCQLVAAGCLCNPLMVLAGLWVAALLLCKGVIGLRVISAPSRAMLMGDVVMSVLGAVVAVMAAAYLVSGHITVSCGSSLHRPDQGTAIRMYILEFTAIVASIPCIAGAVASFIAAALSAQAARTRLDAPVVLFLRSWPQGNEISSPSGRTNVLVNSTDEEIGGQITRDSLAHTAGCEGTGRASTPPPNYSQVACESFA
ncbi:uncharacterized protein LOC108672426 isoform X2 [Hyalella azteca]|uniref:Uncharacterized protein LOC108672426 isoform X2 n=1 Tax=Hyalella azteca TaxID=294128 RepID=A0A979FLQ6_HYAAZ|nr:uncharacterized protein LOC108672426 isoform X2 [Hyalella azteca]